MAFGGDISASQLLRVCVCVCVISLSKPDISRIFRAMMFVVFSTVMSGKNNVRIAIIQGSMVIMKNEKMYVIVLNRK